MTKKEYVKPQILSVREIEAFANGMCTPGDGGGPLGMDKVAFDPNSGLCMNPMT